MANAF